MRPASADRPPIVANWDTIRLRMEAAAVAQQTAISERDKQTILSDRAKRLAAPKERERLEEHLEIIAFQLASETYGIELRHAREVSLIKDLTPLPCTPAFVLGIINVHGRVLSVIDLKRFFDLPNHALTDLNRVIVTRKDGMEVGILADRIHGVQRVSYRDLQGAVPTLTGVHADYLKGITKDRLIVLNTDNLLSDTKLVIRQEPE